MYRTLDITVVSARDLKNINFIGAMDVYAVVSILGAAGSKTTQKLKTPIHKKGGTNPTWNFPMKFNIDEAAIRENKLELHVTIKAVKMFGNKNLGEVIVMINERLIHEALESGENAMHNVTYAVNRETALKKPKGTLSFSYKFSEKIVKEKEKVINIDENKPRNSECCTGCFCGIFDCDDNNNGTRNTTYCFFYDYGDDDDCGCCTCGGCDCGGCDCGGCDCGGGDCGGCDCGGDC